MSLETEAHPSAAVLRDFGLGILREPERSKIETHIRDCSTCCEALQQVDADTIVELAREASATPAPEETPVHPDLPAELVDHPRYRVLQPLGEGGMGTVFQAEHKVMGRVVALKVIHRRLTKDPGIVDRFRNEVKAAAQLSHPNIITAHDAEETNGLHFLVMEFVQGVSLDRYVARRGPLPVALACQFIRQAALGLQHAHERGLVHRDIKPHNLMITRKGQLKVLDFGLARLAQNAGATSPNLVLGTPDFLAPEQARNSHNVDIRADLYSLGCTFYFLLTGRPPFRGENVYEKMVAHTAAEAEPITSFRTDVPAEVEAIVYKLMSKKPEDRFAVPAELVTALSAASKPAASPAAPSPAVPAPPSSSSWSDAAPTALLPAETPADSRRNKRKRKKRGSAPWSAVIAVAAPILLLGVAVAVGWAVYSRVKDRGTDGNAGNATQKALGGIPNPSPATGGGGLGAPARDGRKAVLVVVPQSGLWYDDFEPVMKKLQEGGTRAIVASLAAGSVHAHPGRSRPATTVQADAAIRDVLDANAWDGVIFVGKDVGVFMPDQPAGKLLKPFLEEMVRKNKIVGGLCNGQMVLAAHGLWRGRTIAKPDYLDDYKAEWFAGVTWASTRIYLDSPILSASSDLDAAVFGLQFCRALGIVTKPK